MTTNVIPMRALGLWWLVFLLASTPFLQLVYGVANNSLGPDPAEQLMHSTGEWVMRLLILVLLARPLAQWGYSQIFVYRRMLGLFVFFYASLHLLVFAQVYIGWDAQILGEELTERPYVIVGALAWLFLVPLAITSTRGWRRRLRQHWRRLHQLVYGVAILGWLHLLWLSRSDVGEAVVYGGLFVLLLGWRLAVYVKRHGSRKPRVSA